MTLLTAWLIAFALTLVVSAAIVGYGCVVARFTHNARTSLVLGLGLYTTSILVTGTWGGYRAIVQTLLVLIGIVSAWTYKRYLRFLLPDERPRKADIIWLVLPVVYALTRFFSCGLPQQHSDPLYYHLSAPKQWVELGRIALLEAHPSYSQAALWETLYGLPQIWLGPYGTNNHIITQIYGQWMHMIWGQLGCFFLAASILVELAPALRTRRGLAGFIAWLCISQPAFEWLGCLAKNDYVLCLFILAGVLESFDKRWFLSGLLFGCAYSTKVLAAWAILAFFALVPIGQWWKYGVGVGLASIAFLIRNFLYTHNPLFPNLDQFIGPHWVSTLWVNHNLSFGGGPQINFEMLHWLSRQMLEKALPKILFAVGGAALGYEIGAKKVPSGIAWPRWVAFLGIQFVLALSMLRPAADGRYGNFIAILTALFLMSAFMRLAFELPLKARLAAAPVLLALGLLVNSPVDQLFKIPRDYLFAPAVRYVEQFHPMFSMQEWVMKELSPFEKVLYTAEKQQFYLDRPFETVSEMKKWEDILSPLKSRAELFLKLKELGFRYVHFSPQAGGYPPVLRPYWSEILAVEGRAMFKTPTSLIFDLQDPNVHSSKDVLKSNE